MRAGCSRVPLCALLFLASALAREPAPLALFVGNNRSPGEANPDLRYADDALKYGLLFSTLGASHRIEVLTRPDEGSLGLHGDAFATGPPTRAGLRSAAARLKARVRAARAEGRDAVLYFVLAGLGDEVNGAGFFEREDGRLGGSELSSLLKEIGPKTAHVIHDSCNAFFVIQPRRPGGRIFATPKDARFGLKARGVRVGVFLSTSADAQVFAWSQLQWGISSHVMRAGLSGAGDADRDGRVRYDELEAFVSTSTARVENPLYRPHPYARPPPGDEVLVDLARASGRRERGGGGRLRPRWKDPRKGGYEELLDEVSFDPKERSSRLVAAGKALETRADEIERDRALGAFVLGLGGAAALLGGGSLLAAHYVGALEPVFDDDAGLLFYPVVVGSLLLPYGALALSTALAVPWSETSPVEHTLDLVRQAPEGLAVEEE